jgi:hypothetical protein
VEFKANGDRLHPVKVRRKVPLIVELAQSWASEEARSEHCTAMLALLSTADCSVKSNERKSHV